MQKIKFCVIKHDNNRLLGYIAMWTTWLDYMGYCYVAIGLEYYNIVFIILLFVFHYWRKIDGFILNLCLNESNNASNLK